MLTTALDLFLNYQEKTNNNHFVTPDEALRTAFVGKTVHYLGHTNRNRLTSLQREALAQAGYETEDTNVAGGLVNLASKSRIDLANLKDYVTKKALSLRFDAEVEGTLSTLVNDYHEAYSAVIDGVPGSTQWRSAIARRNEILAQMGTLVIPTNLLMEVRSPRAFKEKTLVAFGLYVFSTLITTRKQDEYQHHHRMAQA